MSALTGVALSERVAQLYGISANRTCATDFVGRVDDGFPYGMYLHQDNQRCFELAIMHCLDVDMCDGYVRHKPTLSSTKIVVDKDIWTWKDMNQYARTAILQCLVEMKEQS